MGDLVEKVAHELAQSGDVRAVNATAILERLRAEHTRKSSQGHSGPGAL